MTSSRRRLRIPHLLVLLNACIVLAALTSWVLPAGRFERLEDASTGRTVVVPGTYAEVPSNPVGLFDAVIALPVGMGEANGALMAILAAAGGPYRAWLRFAGPMYLSLVALGGLAIVAAITIGLA